ncbi:hypothetical protein COCNU_05G005080 [Cocos nucifera]|uniref:Uncharacterized protein n=1 Tax=Cocos nucifera TaxID=13894 RepID=A0A8K0I945_COCNU|nr:hypothetical protein COCNU_05G005080 [Cocos nucifera]
MGPALPALIGRDTEHNMGSAFGQRYDVSWAGGDPEVEKLKQMLVLLYMTEDDLPWHGHHGTADRMGHGRAGPPFKLRREIDTVVGAHRTITDADVARMQYLQAVVQETGDHCHGQHEGHHP